MTSPPVHAPDHHLAKRFQQDPVAPIRSFVFLRRQGSDDVRTNRIGAITGVIAPLDAKVERSIRLASSPKVRFSKYKLPVLGFDGKDPI